MATRKYRSNAEWIEILQHYIQSGLSPIQYCQQKNLDYKYFLKRKRAFDNEQHSNTKSESFVRVQAPTKQITPLPTLILQYQNTQLQITDGTDPLWLAQLIKQLS